MLCTILSLGGKELFHSGFPRVARAVVPQEAGGFLCVRAAAGRWSEPRLQVAVSQLGRGRPAMKARARRGARWSTSRTAIPISGQVDEHSVFHWRGGGPAGQGWSHGTGCDVPPGCDR